MTCQPRIGIRACSRIFSWMSSSDRSRHDLHIHVAHLADEAVYDIPAQELLHAAALGVAQDHVGDAVVLGEADEPAMSRPLRVTTSAPSSRAKARFSATWRWAVAEIFSGISRGVST